MPPAREELATHVNPELLAALRSLSVAEGQQVQALVEEALTDLLEKRSKAGAA